MRKSNYRIPLNGVLNRYCALVLVLESILLNLVVKIVLQHIPPESGQIADISGGLLCAKSGHWPDYSITSSARVRNDSEMVNPIVAAVLRFTISSNLVGN